MSGEPILTIVGNVVADPEARVSQAGKPWVTFRIANTPRVKDRQSGEWADGEPLWVGCRAFGEMADHIAATLTKGMRVIVQGKLTQRSYKDNQGQDRTSLDLEVDEVGPSLRFATAQVTRSQRPGGAAGASGGGGMGEWSQPSANGAQNGFGDSAQAGQFGQPF